jgi:quercetin dioxygenase-like cupin family protein
MIAGSRWRGAIRIGALALAVGSVVALCAAPLRAQSPDTLTWGLGPSSLPAGTRMAIVSGDPTKPGPFTIRLELPDGFTVAPHFHPTDEHQTVISGRIGHGMGDTVNVSAMHWLDPGESGVIPADAHHYVMTRGRTVVAVRSVGPFKVTYVNPADDPRKTTP